MNSAPSKLYSGTSLHCLLLLNRRRCQPARGPPRCQPFLLGRRQQLPPPPGRHSPLLKVHQQRDPFLNSILLLNQLNHVVLIATGVSSCGYIYDSGAAVAGGGKAPAVCAEVLRRLEEFVAADRGLGKGPHRGAAGGGVSSLLSGSLSLALCYILRIFRSGALHPQPRILCLQGSPDGPEQYVAVMNSIFSAQRSMAVFATDLQSRSFLQLLRPVGVDFRASQYLQLICNHAAFYNFLDQ